MRFLLLDALKRLQDHRQSLLAFYLIFTGASLILLTPLASARAWWLEAAVLVVVLIQGGMVVASLDQQDNVTVTAHRGSAFDAPENTLAAIEQAITDGADYVEIDAQLTADGVVVLWHDGDMMRVFGRPDRPHPSGCHRSGAGQGPTVRRP